MSGSTMLYYGGLILLVAVVIGTATAIICFRKRKKQLQAQLFAEYGERRA